MSAAEFEEIPCPDITQSQVENHLATMIGVSAQDIQDRLIIADMLSERSFTKTWATTLNRAQYEGINFGPNLVKENKHRFSYPEGEASGGYRNTGIPNVEPYGTWERNAREVMQWTYNYMLQLSGQIGGFGDLFPVRPTLDRGCTQRFHATHAELKLLTRLMRQGTIGEAQSVLMAVSRHMCEYCKPVVAHLARNGRRRIAVASPRKKTRGASNAIEQPEYILFDNDGSYTQYTRRSTDAASNYRCIKKQFTGAIPAGIDTFRAPDPNFAPPARQIQLHTAKQVQALNRTNAVSRQFSSEDLAGSVRNLACVDEVEGPGSEDVIYISNDLPKSVYCPRPQTMTGIYGTFGPLSVDNPLMVLKSIGSFCDVSSVAPAMGAPSTHSFTLKCPADYQLTGFHGYFGSLVNKIGITCRRISDGAVAKLGPVGLSAGGTPVDKECEFGAAGRQIKLWVGDAIDGLGLGCR